MLSLPDAWARALLKSMPESRCIGSVIRGKPSVRWHNGTELNGPAGFEHFEGD